MNHNKANSRPFLHHVFDLDTNRLRCQRDIVAKAPFDLNFKNEGSASELKIEERQREDYLRRNRTVINRV